MDKLINAAILIVVILAIIYFFLPLLPGVWHMVVEVVVIVGTVVGLMKIAGAWF